MTTYATKNVTKVSDDAPVSTWFELTLESIQVTISELGCELDLDPVGSQNLQVLTNDVHEFEKNYGDDPLGVLNLMNLNTRLSALKKYSSSLEYADSTSQGSLYV